VFLQRQVDLPKIPVKELLKKQLDLVFRQTSAIKNSFPKRCDELQSSSSHLESRSCAPYACDAVVGTCIMQCATGDASAMGNARNTPASRRIAVR
jgi:hypothetical protein